MPRRKYNVGDYEAAVAHEGTHAEAAAAARVHFETARRWRKGEAAAPSRGAPPPEPRKLPIRHVNPHDARAAR